MLEDVLRFGVTIRVPTQPVPWEYAALLSPPTELPDEPFVLTCEVKVTGPGFAGLGALNAMQDDFTHIVMLAESPDVQMVDIRCDRRSNFGGIVIRTHEHAQSCDVELKIVELRVTPYENYTIFQYGKVGSMTIEAALRESVPQSWIQRHHFLSSHLITEILATSVSVLKERDAAMIGTYFGDVGVIAQLKASREAREAYLNKRVEGRAVLITGMRDPVEACVAAFFQQLDYYCPGLSYEADQVLADADIALRQFYAGVASALDDAEPQTSSEGAVKALLQRGIDHWFATEFFGFTGVDISRAKFDSEEPFVRIQSNGHDIILYRFEHLSRALPVMFKLFGLKLVNVPKVNSGTEKRSGAIYAKFKSLFVETPMVTQLLRSSPFCKRFYPNTLADGSEAASGAMCAAAQ